MERVAVGPLKSRIKGDMPAGSDSLSGIAVIVEAVVEFGSYSIRSRVVCPPAVTFPVKWFVCSQRYPIEGDKKKWSMNSQSNPNWTWAPQAVEVKLAVFGPEEFV